MTPDECRDVFEMLSEYIDGDLPAGTCEQIEQHIADCPPCIQFVESLRKSVAVFRDFRPAENAAPLTPEARETLAKAYRQMIQRKQGQAMGRSVTP